MKVCCLGDSVTAAYRLEKSACYTELLSGEGIFCIACGVSGDTAPGMLARFQTLALSPPAVLFVFGGTNDLFFTDSDDTVRASLSAISFQAASRGLSVLLAELLPVIPEALPPDWRKLFASDAVGFPAGMPDINTRIRLLNEWLTRFGSAFGIPVCPLHDAFLQADGTPDAALFSDGLHPNAAGHRIIADCLKQSLASA